MARITETVSTEELQAEIERLRELLHASPTMRDLEVRAAEREACARVADNALDPEFGTMPAKSIAAAIRARGESDG